jgi:hypothetical protein
VPVTLLFQQAGKVSFKAITSESSDHGMDHTGHHKNISSAGHSVPQVALSVAQKPDESGWQFDVSTEDFTFFKPQSTAPHSPGQGHAHISEWAQVAAPLWKFCVLWKPANRHLHSERDSEYQYAQCLSRKWQGNLG